MGDVTFIIEGLDDWIDGFEELSHGPSREMRDEWADASRNLFVVSQSLVHVVTGELKSSGSIDVDQHGSVFEMVLSYDADHAIYEHARGGSHAWMDRAWEVCQDDFAEALARGWVRTVESWS